MTAILGYIQIFMTVFPKYIQTLITAVVPEYIQIFMTECYPEYLH